MNPNLLRSIALCATLPVSALAWTPGIADPDASTGLAVDITNNADVASFYQCIYKASEGTSTLDPWITGMEGSIIDCVPGTTTGAFQENVLRRVNYFRAMADLPGSISFNQNLSLRSQAAALATAANDVISHSPSGECISQMAIEGARDGNIALGTTGADAIDVYMDAIEGENATIAIARRWLLRRSTTEMGTGDFPAIAPAQAAQSLNVVKPAPGQAPTDASQSFVSWPPGKFRFSSESANAQTSEEIVFVPFDTVSQRWSIQYASVPDNAGERFMFFGTAIQMFLGEDASSIPSGSSPPNSIPISNVFQEDGAQANSNVFTAPGLAWDPDWNGSGAGLGTPPLNQVIRVDLEGLVNVPDIGMLDVNNLSYNVVFIDPEVLPVTARITGLSEVPPEGSNYTFTLATSISDTPVPAISGYDLRVVRRPFAGGPALVTETSLASTATSFSLDEISAGAPLQGNQTFDITIRPIFDGHDFGTNSEAFVVDVFAAQGFATWVDEFDPAVPSDERGFNDDPDSDGSTNGIEYAFGLNPTDPTDAPPAFAITTSGGTLTFDPNALDYDTEDIVTRLLTSPDLSGPWTELTPGPDGITYTIPAATDRFFYRWEVEEVEVD